MSEYVYLLTICLPLAVILIIFGMRYLSKVQQAKVRIANDDAYRKIAEQAVSTQSETATALAAIQGAMTDVRARLTAVEKILKDVE
jgi:uncharacterized membrane protein